MTTSGRYLLLWKGRQSGPFSMDQIRDLLTAGEISRVHQIRVDDRWQVLDDFLEKLRLHDSEARRAEQQRLRDAETRRRFDRQSADERASLLHPLSKQPPVPPSPEAHADFISPLGAPPFGSPAGVESGTPPSPFPQGQLRTSGFAVTALVMGICNFIPYVNFVSWILALVFGHIAVFQTNSDDSLKGRGMALAGLIITYFLLVMGLTVIVLCLANNKPLPIHF